MSKSLTPMFSTSKILGDIKKFGDEREKRIVMALARAGAEFANHAKDTGDYNNVTGNLRNSIGFTVILDGQKKVTNVGGGAKGGHDGRARGREFAAEMAANPSNYKGAVLIGFAGMEYASAVESKGRSVITQSIPVGRAAIQEYLAGIDEMDTLGFGSGEYDLPEVE